MHGSYLSAPPHLALSIFSSKFSLDFLQSPNGVFDHLKVKPFQQHAQSFAFNPSVETDPEFVSIATLLNDPDRYHEKVVTVRGIVKQPEMHLDETELFFDFVFVLQQETISLIVFGRHDRTQGGSPIAMDHHVEVTGIFWKDRIAHDYHFENNLEAITVTPYPSLTPNQTSFH